MIIAFGHKKRVGKDTARKFMAAHLRATGYTGHIDKVSFADELKKQCYKLFDWAGMRSPDHYDNFPNDRNIVLEPIGKTVRQIWIEYGNKVREMHNDIWIDLALRMSYGDLILIADCRYPNEAEKIKQVGGKIIRIDNPRVEKTDDVADCALDNYNDWDYVITNDGSLQNLHTKVVEIVDDIRLSGLLQ